VPRTTILRDLAALTVAALLWWLDATGPRDGGIRSMAIATGAGIGAAIAGFLLHEWGHLAGALVVGSRVHFPDRVLAPLLFHFDTVRNDRRQFLWMSYGGYAASALGVGAIVALAPLGRWSGQLALGLAGLGTLITLIAEIPTTVRVHCGAPLPQGYAFQQPGAP
jgi:hypothetical protein